MTVNVIKTFKTSIHNPKHTKNTKTHFNFSSPPKQKQSKIHIFKFVKFKKIQARMRRCRLALAFLAAGPRSPGPRAGDGRGARPGSPWQGEALGSGGPWLQGYAYYQTFSDLIN